jgi:hypothetical protein
MTNAIRMITPYRHSGTWVFDDPEVELVREPFIEGVPAMIDDLVSNIPDAREAIRLTFSEIPLSGYQRELAGSMRNPADTGTVHLNPIWKVGYSRRCSSTSTRRRKSCMFARIPWSKAVHSSVYRTSM